MPSAKDTVAKTVDSIMDDYGKSLPKNAFEKAKEAVAETLDKASDKVRDLFGIDDKDDEQDAKKENETDRSAS